MTQEWQLRHMPRCRYCSTQYKPARSMQPGRVCNDHECQVQYALEVTAKKRAQKATAERKADRAKRDSLKTLSDHLREAQVVFNAYIRERDKDLPCISCGRYHQGAWDAGHYRSVGAAGALRFDEANVHRQCCPCNQHKSGNILEYRIGLIARMGQGEVDRIEGPLPVVKWTVEQVSSIKAEYRAKLKELRRQHE